MMLCVIYWCVHSNYPTAIADICLPGAVWDHDTSSIHIMRCRGFTPVEEAGSLICPCALNVLAFKPDVSLRLALSI